MRLSFFGGIVRWPFFGFVDGFEVRFGANFGSFEEPWAISPSKDGIKQEGKAE